MWTINFLLCKNGSMRAALYSSHYSCCHVERNIHSGLLKSSNLKKQIFDEYSKLDRVLFQKFYTKHDRNLVKCYVDVTRSFDHMNTKFMTNLSDLIFWKIEKMTKSNNLLQCPKEMINNFFDQLARKLGYNYLRLTPTFEKIDYRSGRTFWSCEYNIKWPEEKMISFIDSNKRGASNGSALAVLNFLCEKNVISSKGAPLLCRNNSENCLPINVTRMYCTKSSKNRENEEIDVLQVKPKIEETQHSKISHLFPNPKHTLGNVCQTVANDKGSREFLLSSSYKQVQKSWVCTHKIKWPEERSFSVTSSTKRQASTKCAWEALEYLLKNNRIDKKGVPILYDKQDIKALVKENIPILSFEDNHMEKLQKIVEFHTQQLFPILVECTEKIEKTVEKEESSDDVLREYQQRFLGYNKYRCKEPVHLPVSDYKEAIIEMVKGNRVVIVKGEPGCGKSTRIPQYILEGWAREAVEMRKPCRIVVTEPRRIAAVSLADRVALEREEEVGNIVGYQVRFKSNFQKNIGRILYCTNGILLQYFKSDPDLKNFTHIVVDEAHERDINTDLLLNMLKRVLDRNPSLKVVIMSATIDTDLFQDYFKGSALMHIPGFTYPVKSHYIDNCTLNLEKTIKMCNEPEPSVVHEDVVKILLHLHEKKPEGAILCFLPGWEDIRKIRNLMPNTSDMTVLCLHSRLQDSEQWKIFSRTPPGVRKIILSTNIAETSVTIDDVVYVVDTGIHKETRLDVDRGVMCIDNHWISRSSMDQRRGRAGRCRPGESFHLYPKAKAETVPEFSLPEMLRVSLTKVVLDSKVYSQDMNASEFFSQLPSPPSQQSVELSVQELKDLELLDDDEKLTPLGEVVVNFQLEPKLSKVLVNSVIYKCVTPIVDIVTVFSMGSEIFASGLERKDQIRSVKARFSKTSDHMAMMRIYEIWDEFRESGRRDRMEKFCQDLFILPARMNNLKALRDIHFDYLHDGLKCRVLPISDDFSDEDEIVKGVLLSGVGTFLTHRNWDIVKGRMKRTNMFHTRLNHKATVTPESVNFKNISLNSKFLLYINETRSNVRRTTVIRETSVIPAIMLLLFSNKKLLLENITKDQYSPNLKSDDQVILKLSGTRLNFILDREQALTIMQCKLALNSCYDHYVYQLTKGGEYNATLNQLWDELLSLLNDFLKDFKNE
ncbi:hypothetical protein HHI36_003615 [Cryptolaemus montrouzieri]|uniref:ATP-dependent RNA helicase DHX30 n=1 Tax=Cryptolaemus montrouzieri TaxID=559131 RepID=A0ABD2PEI4_9CUCU